MRGQSVNKLTGLYALAHLVGVPELFAFSQDGSPVVSVCEIKRARDALDTPLRWGQCVRSGIPGGRYKPKASPFV